MTCPRSLDATLDANGEAGPRTAEINEHIAECAECRETVATAMQLAALACPMWLSVVSAAEPGRLSVVIDRAVVKRDAPEPTVEHSGTVRSEHTLPWEAGPSSRRPT